MTPQFTTFGLVLALLVGPAAMAQAGMDDEVQRIVARRLDAILPAGAAGGAAVAVRIDGQTMFFNFGLADVVRQRPVTPDLLFGLGSLRKPFEATLLARAVQRGDVSLDDPAAKYVHELQRGGDIRRVTLGQLATHTSGLLLPQDHPPWPDWGYTLPEFIRTLNAWKADREHPPGSRQQYTHAGYVLLQLALERRYGVPIDAQIRDHILRPLGMTATVLPRGEGRSVGELTAEQRRRAVQGYDADGVPQGRPGEQRSYYNFPGGGKMYSSARDLSVLLAAALGAQPVKRELRDALAFTQAGSFRMGPRNVQALAWEIVESDDAPTIIEKPGGLWNASAYIGMMHSRGLGLVILANRGDQPAYEVGREILLDLARWQR
jgi:beta-lactamase class C